MAKLRNRYKDKPPQDALAQREQSLGDRADLVARLTGKALSGATGNAIAAEVLARSAPPRPLVVIDLIPEPPPRLPDAHRTGKALGFRSWKLDGYTLFSANEHFGGWKIGAPTEATCRAGAAGPGAFMWQLGGTPPAEPPPEHDAPHPGCQCGLYALHAPEFMSRWHHDEPLMVHGAVLGWGRMEVHHEGWRAQYAQPVMLAYDGDRQPYNHVERVKAMGAELELPVVPWPEFEAEARKFAEPVPKDLRPEGRAVFAMGAGAASLTQQMRRMQSAMAAQVNAQMAAMTFIGNTPNGP